MMTEAIERQLVEWGGEKEATRYAFRTIGGSKVCISLDGELYVETKGNDMRAYDIAAAPWKTLDDIRRVLDVFGVALKEPPKWTVTLSNIVSGPKTVAVFYREDGCTDNPEAAAEYAAMMNAKESPPVPTKPHTVEEWMAVDGLVGVCVQLAGVIQDWRWYSSALPWSIYGNLPSDMNGITPVAGGTVSLRYATREAAIAALEVALRKAGELQ